MNVFIIDLNFLEKKGEIATYLLMHSAGAILIDPGPETTLPVLTSSLKTRGLTARDVTHVLLTHIHLDHAGAAGWFAQQGAYVYVHPAGVPHMLNPEKLVASASRLYGEWMDKLWGNIKPVTPDKLVEIQDEEEIVIGELRIKGLHTPGHAKHHIAYIYEDVIFSGDVGGVRFEPNSYVRLPFVPPETELKKWRDSLDRMRRTGCNHIAPTHFGIFKNAKAHLTRAVSFLDEVETWLERNMSGISDIETMELRYADFLRAFDQKAGLDEATLDIYDRSDPINFAAIGLFRYWQKENTKRDKFHE